MPIEASTDFSYYKLRHEMPPGQDITCEISYIRLDERRVLCRAEFLNESDAPQNAVLHGVMSFNPLSHEPAVLSLPESGTWIDAVGHVTEIHAPREDDSKQSLIWSGRIRGQFEDSDLVQARGLSSTVLCRRGDRVVWCGTLEQELADPLICLRYRLPGETPVMLPLRLHGTPVSASLHPTGHGFDWCMLEAGPLAAGEVELMAEGVEGIDMELDGFAVIPKDGLKELGTVRQEWNRVPERTPSSGSASMRLQYQPLEEQYGLAWGADPFQVREFYCDRIEDLLCGNVNNQIKERFEDPEGVGHFTNLYLRPISVPAGGRRVCFLLLCTGSEKEVEARLSGFDAEDPGWEEVYEQARSTRFRVGCLPSGDPVCPGQARMAANLLSNIVYPIGCRGEWIAHWTPGRWWDSLYTWDAGFHAIGLANIEPAHARTHIGTYLIGDEAPDTNAFVHWGTPIPTQFHALNCLSQRSPEAVDWQACFPALERANAFLIGEAPGAATNPFQSGLLVTWDYFYNSGGWDDYPPQEVVHARHLESSVASASTTAHSLRFAKWLHWIQPDSGQKDVIQHLTHALMKYAWDEEAGVFSYVQHDRKGCPNGFLCDASGINLNLGMDGIIPLTAGICSQEQVERMVERLFDPAGMWTPIGITSVDQRASYYRHDGYWNGAVWFPHQWMIWKSLLDHGYGDEAWQLASTALQLWQKEVERSGRCFEHFIVQGGCGAGWHQFGGLSAPVLDWFAAYHTPDRLTGGLDVMVTSVQTGKEWSADVEVLPSTFTRGPLLLATVGGRQEPQVCWNQEPVPFIKRLPGTLEIQLPVDAGKGRLVITG